MGTNAQKPSLLKLNLFRTEESALQKAPTQPIIAHFTPKEQNLKNEAAS